MEVLLERAGREDLAAKFGGTPILSEEFSRTTRMRTFYSQQSPRAYSLEFDASDSVVILDVSHTQDIVAVHTLRSYL